MIIIRFVFFTWKEQGSLRNCPALYRISWFGLITIKGRGDINHVLSYGHQIFLRWRICVMIFSKSFGYAVRGILYIGMVQDEKRLVQVEEIAAALAVPRHFLGKIMKQLVKASVLSSVKGPAGGFRLNEHTLRLRLIDLYDLTDGMEAFNKCVLRVRECNSMKPCPLHFQMEGVKTGLNSVLTNTVIGDMLRNDKPGFLKTISTLDVIIEAS
jgi:Rrf2 family iron-sulfur cluster assembly transcriptional regulator